MDEYHNHLRISCRFHSPPLRLSYNLYNLNVITVGGKGNIYRYYKNEKKHDKERIMCIISRCSYMSVPEIQISGVKYLSMGKCYICKNMRYKRVIGVQGLCGMWREASGCHVRIHWARLYVYKCRNHDILATPSAPMLHQTWITENFLSCCSYSWYQASK